MASRAAHAPRRRSTSPVPSGTAFGGSGGGADLHRESLLQDPSGAGSTRGSRNGAISATGSHAAEQRVEHVHLERHRPRIGSAARACRTVRPQATAGTRSRGSDTPKRRRSASTAWALPKRLNAAAVFRASSRVQGLPGSTHGHTTHAAPRPSYSPCCSRPRMRLGESALLASGAASRTIRAPLALGERFDGLLEPGQSNGESAGVQLTPRAAIVARAAARGTGAGPPSASPSRGLCAMRS